MVNAPELGWLLWQVPAVALLPVAGTPAEAHDVATGVTAGRLTVLCHVPNGPLNTTCAPRVPVDCGACRQQRPRISVAREVAEVDHSKDVGRAASVERKVRS